ncbi:hypothetical protein BJ170DRAFT_302569 [Xylariales sp. AK1849]|nr:hypothetical protein BJ170DRAFT_302569 [Xylariales sp. AK1849]
MDNSRLIAIMDSSNLLEKSCHADEFVMGGRQRVSEGITALIPESRRKPATTATRLDLRTNFSYPRPDGHPPNHESTDSWSSLTSDGSMPGMTDASDSEASVDDDYHYNLSTNELWDSFFPKGADKTQPVQQPQNSTTLQSPSCRDYFSLDYYRGRFQESEDDTVTTAKSEQKVQDGDSSQWPLPRASPLRCQKARNPASYSVYPKLSSAPNHLNPLPPRTSSLTPEVSSHTKGRTLNDSKCIANIKSSKSNMSHCLAPPAAISNSTIMQAQSLPATPAGSATRLYLSKSAYNIREESHISHSQHHTTACLTPFIPNLPDQLSPRRPQHECFVSVFELDSDNESNSDSSGFAKRLARGLQHKKSGSLQHEKSGSLQHKKAGSEKPSSGEKKAVAASMGTEGTDNLARRRGVSLGRILGLKSR